MTERIAALLLIFAAVALNAQEPDEHVEVGILVQQRSIVSDRDGGDQAVDQLLLRQERFDSLADRRAGVPEEFNPG